MPFLGYFLGWKINFWVYFVACNILGYLFGWKINFWVYFVACNKFLGQVFSLQYIFGSDFNRTLNYMLILLTLYKLCAVQIRHIISTGKDVKYKQVNH